MSNLPTVSIIIPYHKKKNFFLKTFKSIVNQTFKNFEIILVYDDTDYSELKNLKKIIKNYPKTKLFVNQKIEGAGSSRNKAIKFSKGKFIAFCDADDIWHKDKLKYQLDFMNKNRINFSHTSYHIINDKNKKIGTFLVKNKLNRDALLKSCDIGLSTVIIKKKLLKGKNFCNLKTKEDYNLWLQLIKKEKHFYGIKRPLASWRFLKLSLSSSIFQKLCDAYKLYNKYQNFSTLISIFYVLRLSYYAYIKKFNIYN